MPSGIQGLIAARLDTLSRERKRLLQDAAVIGKVFWSGAVAQMGGRDPGEVALRSARAVSQGAGAPGAPELDGRRRPSTRFITLWSGMCATRQIPRAERAECHRRAAAWIEQAVWRPDRGSRRDPRVALRRRARVRRPAPVPTRRSSGQAIHYLTLAGDRSLAIDVERRGAPVRAGARLAPETAPERPGILARHAEALLQRGRFAEAAEAFEQAIVGFQRARARCLSMATAMVRLSIVLSRLADPRERSIVDQAVRVLEPLGPSPELVAVLAGAATTYMVVGRT